jgi:heterodisulfide reductase subunit A
MRAALDVAESGHKVYLLDRSPKVGGTLSQLDKWFPTDDCSFCKLLPLFYTAGAGEFCLRRTLIHPNIEILTSSELASVSGEAGDFEVKITRRPQMVDRARCIGCDKCVSVCPIEVEDEFNEGLAKRKAVYLSHPNAVPNNYVIDPETCTRCGKCVEICPTRAIDLDAKNEVLTLKVGAIIADPGFESFEPDELEEFGYVRYPNVVTSIELERMLSGTSPGGMKKIPKRVAFFQCVGSRDEKRPYCSSACCMCAIKEANLLKEKYPDSELSIFYMDMRAFGKGYYRYYMDAVRRGIRFVRSRVPGVKGITDSGELLVSYEDESGKFREEKFDMVVLSVGQTEPSSTRELAEKLGIETNPYGFCEGLPYDQVATTRKGIYVCGSFSSPADIPDTVMRASGAASLAIRSLPESAEQASPPAEGELEVEPVTGVFLCSCGDDIARVVDLAVLSERVRNLRSVKTVSNVNFLCISEGLANLKETIEKEGLNRIVVAACSVHPYEMLFKKTLEAAGVDPEALAVVNIREQLSWVHDKSETANKKAMALIEGAVQNMAARKFYPAKEHEVIKRCLVIGAGLSGMTSALDLADRGFDVELVEKENRLGGRLIEKPANYDGDEVVSILRERIKAVMGNPRIHVRFNCEVKSLQGSAGDFEISIASEGKQESIRAGAIIIAVGALEHKTDQFGYGQSDRIMAPLDFEKALFKPDSALRKGKIFAFIQCVGSRTDERPFCSRVCCSEAVFNALKVKELIPGADAFVLYRDIMTYGFNEDLYRKARNAGVVFIRYELDDQPSVKMEDSRPRIIVKDPLLGETLSLRPDYLVLAFGMDAAPAEDIARALGLETTEDRFLKEANVKFRPVDVMRDGIYVCGPANSPMSASESVTSAHAAAARAGTILSKKYIPARPAVAEVNKRRCSACELCIATCPFEARYMDHDEMVARVIEHICQGCGACSAVCPNGATKLRRYEEKDMFSLLETLT